MKIALSQRTLIVQPLPGIGDMVWHLPHIHAIATTTVEGRVDILTKPRSQADRLLSADARVGKILWLERETGHHAGIRGLLRLAALLRRENYQRVWFLHGSARYVLAAWWAKVPERIGYGIGTQSLFLSVPVHLPHKLHHAHPILRADALLDALDIPRSQLEPQLPLRADAHGPVVERFAGWATPWIALGIGSSESCKQWGAARFAELALALYHLQVGSIFIVGGLAERALADAILAHIHTAGGKAADAVALPLEQTACLLSLCRCYIGNDTGILNLAAALQILAIGLFGASPPLTHSRFIHPILPSADQQGMAAITVPHVLEAFMRLCLANEDSRAS